MNSESAKELLKLQNSALVCRHGKRKGNFAFLTSSGGKFYEFFVTFLLVIHPLTVKNRPCALIWACALNRKNTVIKLEWPNLHSKVSRIATLMPGHSIIKSISCKKLCM